jgi:hypothetical protein
MRNRFIPIQKDCFKRIEDGFKLRGEKTTDNMLFDRASLVTGQYEGPASSAIRQVPHTAHHPPANQSRQRSIKASTAPVTRPVDKKCPGGRRKKRGPVALPKVITPLHKYLYVPGNTLVEGGRLEPIGSLEPQKAQDLDTALEGLWHHNPKLFNKACTVTSPKNHRTYVVQQKCLAHYIIWNNSDKNKDMTKWEKKHACSACTSSICRPCVKLEWHPDDPAGDENAILVFYPLPEPSRPPGITWRDVKFYI